MATSMSMSKYSGYPTETAMRVNVSFSVTYAGSYYTYFELYDEDDNLIEEAQGTTYSMSANSSKSGIYKTFTGLDPGTSYYIVGSLWNASTDTRLSITEPVVYFKTESAFEPPTISVTSFASTSSEVTLTCKITVPSDGKYYVVFEVWYLGTSQTHTSSSFTTGRSLSWTFSDIPSRTDVTGYVRVYDYSTDEEYDYDSDSVTTEAPSWPGNWYWETTVSKGSEMAYSRISDTEIKVYPLTASEWNNFVDRVLEVREYLGLSPGNLTALYVSRGDPFEADIPEAMRQVLDGMNPPTAVPSAITSGRNITAAFFNGLKNSLNSFKE